MHRTSIGSFIDFLVSALWPDCRSNIRRDISRIQRPFTSVDPPKIPADADVMEWYGKVVAESDPLVTPIYLVSHLYLLGAPLLMLITMRVVLQGYFPMMLVLQTTRYMFCSWAVAELFGRWSFIRAVKIAAFIYFLNFALLTPVVGFRVLFELDDSIVVFYHEALLYAIIIVFAAYSTRVRQERERFKLTTKLDHHGEPYNFGLHQV